MAQRTEAENVPFRIEWLETNVVLTGDDLKSLTLIKSFHSKYGFVTTTTQTNLAIIYKYYRYSKYQPEAYCWYKPLNHNPWKQRFNRKQTVTMYLKDLITD